MEQEFVKKKAVAKFLGITIATLDRWAKKGICPAPIKLGPRLVRYRRSEILAWLDNR